MSCEEPIEIVPCEGFGAGSLQPVQVVDRSPRGIGLVVPRPMRPGSQFVTRVDRYCDQHAIYTVRHCTLTAHRAYRVGAERAA